MRVLDAYPWIGEAFADVREEQNGAQVSAQCILKCHKNARLRFALGDDGRLLLTCMHPGCNTLEILRAVGKSFKDCWPDQKIPDKVRRDITALYQYRDESNRVLYEVVRFEPGWNGRDKDLRPRYRSPESPSTWTWATAA